MDESLKGREPYGPSDELSGTDHRSLLGLVGRLLTRIDQGLGDSRSPGSVDRWEDDTYIYFEATLPDGTHQCLDVGAHDGKVFIRIEKAPPEEMSAP